MTAAVLGILLLAPLRSVSIPAPSMSPAIAEGDRLLVEKASVWAGLDPDRGDIVVFRDPGGWLPPTPGGAPRLLAKRIIGVPGDTITCCDAEGRLSINGTALDESDYLLTGAPCAVPSSMQARVPCAPGALDVGPIPEGHLFVLGDNRANSADSATFLCHPGEPDCADTVGLVPLDDVVSRAIAVVTPLDHLSWLDAPAALTELPD